MGFGEAVRTCMRKYVDFYGRASRAEYWWFLLFAILVDIVAGILDSTLWPSAGSRTTGPLGGLASLALFLPLLAVFVRRMHDLDRTGWWALFFDVAYIGFGVAAGVSLLFGTRGLAGIFVVLLLAVSVWQIVWTGMKGTTGANRFGPDPLAGDNLQTPAPAPAV